MKKRHARSQAVSIGIVDLRPTLRPHLLRSHGDVLGRACLPRALFGLFPFLLILVMLVGAIGFPEYCSTGRCDDAFLQTYRWFPCNDVVIEPAREAGPPL